MKNVFCTGLRNFALKVPKKFKKYYLEELKQFR
jgi:hypothetical protein